MPAQLQSLGWIWDENFAPFLQFTAALLRYDLSDEELMAYDSELAESDAETGKWVSVEMPVGQAATRLHLARDAGTSVVHVKAATDPQVASQLQGVVGLLAMFEAKQRGA